MAARKKRAARKVESETKPVTQTLREFIGFKVPSADKRPEAWHGILVARANGAQIPRDLRVYDESRFTGEKRVAQVQALSYIDVPVEDAARIVLKAAMDEHRGEKHCDW